MIVTRDAVRTRVWAAAPPLANLDMVADIRVMRDEDVQQVRRNAAGQAAELGSTEASAAAGASLLAHLGR